MTVSAYLDSFAVSTAIAGTTQARTGYGFTPKAIIVWGLGRTGSTSQTGQLSMSGAFGFAAGPSSRACVGVSDPHGASTSDPDSFRDSAAVYGEPVQGRLDVQSFDSDGVTFVVDTEFLNAHEIFVLALGGSSLLNATVMNITGPASDGPKAHTGAGFRPNVGIFAYEGGFGNRMSFGAAAGENGSIVNKCTSFGADDGSTSNTFRRYRTARCFDSSDSVIFIEGNVNTWDSDGLTVEWQNPGPGGPSSGDGVDCLLLGTVPGSISLHEINTLTNTTTDIPISGLSASPTFGLVASTASAANSAEVDALISCGAFSGSTNRCYTYFSIDGAGTSSVTTSIDAEDVYFASPISTGQMRVHSFNNTGVVFRMSTSGLATFPAWVLVGGGRPTVRGAPIFF